MADPFVAEIRIVPYTFAPRGWAFCNGQILPISQNTALFSLLGTMYGGDGKSNFALPNLQGRMAVGQGQGPGLSARSPGETGGSASVTLQANQVPPHSHALMATISPTSASPAGALLAPTANGSAVYRSSGPLVAMAPESIAPAGGGQPHENRQPYLALNFCIALQGIYPARG